MARMRRIRRGRGFSYHEVDGTLIEDPEVRERIEAAVVDLIE
jgi:DNA topoisomerase IB